MNSQPSKHPHPERMRPLFPMLNKNAGPISKLENRAQVSEQGQGSTNNADPGQYLVLHTFRQQRRSRRLRRWLCQLRNDRSLYLVLLTDIFRVKHIKWRRKVLVGEMCELDRNELAISLSSPGL